MQKILLIIITSILMHQSFAQKTIAKCWIWKAKEGQEKKFEAGYHQHFLWHKQNGDNPTWFCWQYVSGPKYGQYLDVSFNSWKDLDVSLKPNEDDSDYQLHVKPYVEFQNSFKLAYQGNVNSGDSTGLHSKYIRLVTLTVNDITSALKMVEKLKEKYRKDLITKNFFVYKVIDGGNINQLVLMLGFRNYEDYGRAENLQNDICEMESLLKTKIVKEILSETLESRSDLL